MAEMVTSPNVAHCAYPAMDLLEHPSFVQENLRALRTLQHELPPELGVVVGYVEKNKSAAGKPLHNTAALIHQRRILLRQHKTLLPTYDVFDEARYFEPSVRANRWSRSNGGGWESRSARTCGEEKCRNGA